jgi:predicted ribosome quality control (RQC) complex YloA/Tae2 family protein
MSLSIAEITQVLAEIEPVLREGWIQKIYQPTAHTLVFEIRVRGHTHRLLVACQPETARLHLVTRALPNPPSPPAFCQYLRAHFQGARSDGFRQIPDDRIVEWKLTTKEGPRILLCELTGRKANLSVLDAERIVLRQLDGDREGIGRTYHLPEKKGSASQEHLASRFVGAASNGNVSVSAAIEAHYHDQDIVLAVAAANDSRLRALKKAVKKGQRRIEAWRDDLAKAAKFRAYAHYGELLKSNLGVMQKGMDQVVVIDYFDESMPELTIPLDRTKSAQGNMDDYFRKYRKYLAAEQELRPRIEHAERDLEKLRHEVKEIERGTWSPAPSPAERTPMMTRRQEKGRTDQQRGPFRRFTSSDGLPIFVGRNAQENDRLTFGLAKSDDLWLHARGIPGSHVVVRLEKGKDVPPVTLQEAAMLALLYSDLKKSGKGDVIYTKRKWVRKAKGQAPGSVIVTREASLQIRLDKTRLAALKERGRQGVY